MHYQIGSDVNVEIWKYPPHYERNSILTCEYRQAPGGAGPETFHVEFGDGRGLIADAALLPALLQVMGVGRLEDLSGIEVEVSSERLPGFAELQNCVFVFPTANLRR